MRNLKKKKLNNDKGFSFLLIIVAMSFVAILIAIMLLVAYQNYQMKHTGLKSEDNFYTAEQVLDEIKAGLQTDISTSVSEAYTYVLERYSETDKQDTTRNWYFRTKYVDTLRARLIGDVDGYNLTLLESYVQKTKEHGTVLLEAKGNLQTDYDKGVTLKGLKVTYTDDRGLVSIISTDLRLTIPTIDFTQSSSSPDLLKYCVVAEEGIIVDGGKGGTPEKLTGNVYAGTNGLDISGNKAVLSIENERTIVKDGITVGSGASLNFDGNALWTNSINLSSAKLTTNGNIFVKDDMTLAGAKNSVTLTGRYYGFSNPDFVKSSSVYNDSYITETSDASLSSAIIVNGRESELNLAGLDSMFIAGNAYINAKTGASGESSLSVQMGESVSVKGNQLAYLVPENALVVTVDGKVYEGNPITELPSLDKVDISLNVNMPLAELGGATLASLNIGADDFQIYYRPSVAYIYMSFDSDVIAANYFNAYSKADINKYKTSFLSEFTVDPNKKVNFTLNGSAFEEVTNQIVDPEETRVAQVEANGYQDMFFAFCKKLIPTYSTLTEAEKSSTVYDNLLKESELRNYILLNGEGTNTFVYTTPGTKLQAILYDGSEYDISELTAEELERTRLIVATGDVVLDGDIDFKGTIVCGGTFTMGTGATVTSAPDEVSAVFQCVYREVAGESVVAPNNKSPMSFFKEGHDYILDGISSGIISGSVGNIIDLSDIIIYENWKKL